MTSSTYRPDIDGLRAVSILLVIAFHAAVPGVAGGFVGVDVFFVISGFLITGLLLREFGSAGRIDLPAFWARRVRRLGPALFTVLACTLLAAPFALERISGETGSLSRAALATLALNANHFFYLQSADYFSAAAETNPLLHMWSLSVEEQYYLLWPLLLLAMMKSGRRGTQFALMGVGTLASLVISWRWTGLDNAAAFYWMPARAWQLLAGGILALAMSGRTPGTRPWLSNLLALLGLSLIVLGACAWAGAAAFPFPMALLPVAGSAMVLAAGEMGREAFTVRLLGSRPIRYVGKISYPLYLWHWPLLVMSRSTRLYAPSLTADLLMLVVAAVLAALTYEFVEKGCWRKLRQCSNARILAYGTMTAVLVAAIALLIGAWARFGWFYSEKEAWLDASRKDTAKTRCIFKVDYPANDVVDRCFPTGGGKPSVLLWGDSHANHWGPALKIAAGDAGANFGMLTLGGCKPVLGDAGTPECQSFNRRVAGNLGRWKSDKNLRGLILSARWPEGTGAIAPSVTDQARSRKAGFYFNGAQSESESLDRLQHSLAAVLKAAKAQNLRVLIVLPGPIQRYSASHCVALKTPGECYVSVARMREYAGKAEARIARLAVADGEVRIIDPKSFLCVAGKCPVVLHGNFVYVDDEHISRTASIANAFRFAEDVRWLAGQPADATPAPP